MAHLPDTNEIKSLLAAENAAGWRDDAGNTLLHHAARLGDLGLVQECFVRGLPTLAVNDDGDRPLETARSWGRDAAAALIASQQGQEKFVAPELKYATVAELRAATGGFYMAVKKSSFQSVLALALKTGESLMPEDFLTPAADGNTPLLVLCERGELPLLLNTDLWLNAPAAFKTVWKQVPQAYQKDLDIGGFTIRLTQAKLRLSSQAPKWRGPQQK